MRYFAEILKHLQLQRELIFLLTICYFCSYSQNETKQWYIGYNAALDFNVQPAAATYSSAMYSEEGNATISDAAGNLLFYSNGEDVWNRNHVIMANGGGLFGHTSTSQSAIILKQPGMQSVYYIFTLDQQGLSNGLRYSIVDMSLAAGMGSVTAKNVSMYAPSAEKLCAVKHCNNKDYWVLSHEFGTNVFRAYLLSSAGVALAPVISSVGTPNPAQSGATPGEMKVSPNGRKLGYCYSANFTTTGSVELFDFNNATGQISNPLSLLTTNEFCYGASFSPNSSKFYVTEINLAFSFSPTIHQVYQWDVCSNNNQAISASKAIFPTNKIFPFGLQLGNDGKLYVGNSNKKYLGAINFPDLVFPACQYQDSAVSISPKGPAKCLPNFQSSFFKPVSQMGYTTNCQFASFEAVKGASTLSCANATADINSVKWNFGDAGSGTNNISFATNPGHTFSGIGSFTTQLILYYNCYSDTLYQVIQVPALAPVFSVNGSASMCSGETRTLSVTNANYNYGWSNNTTGTVTSISPTIASAYTVTATDPNTGCTANRVFQVSVSKCTNIAGERLIDEIKFYPNPVSSVLFAKGPVTNVEIQIIDELGRCVLTAVSGNNEEEIQVPISHLQNGLYFIKFETPTESRIEKFIKME